MEYRDHLNVCPLADVHRRLDNVHMHWHMALENYFMPDDFLPAAQTCIQTLRTVTVILQAKKKELDGFDSWYAGWQELMRDDEVMRWSVKARNKIEKQGDLETKSSVTAEIIASHLDELPPQKVPVRICDTVSEILARVISQ